MDLLFKVSSISETFSYAPWKLNTPTNRAAPFSIDDCCQLVRPFILSLNNIRGEVYMNKHVNSVHNDCYKCFPSGLGKAAVQNNEIRERKNEKKPLISFWFQWKFWDFKEKHC